MAETSSLMVLFSTITNCTPHGVPNIFRLVSAGFGGATLLRAIRETFCNEAGLANIKDG